MSKYNVIIVINNLEFDLKYDNKTNTGLDKDAVKTVIDYVKKGRVAIEDVIVQLNDGSGELMREASIDNDWSKTLPQLEKIRTVCRVEGLKINFAGILPITVK
tara:strand:- start:3530 stop:3838 length:309 start_codon:yes stop_codon:yes gene_type:complete